MMKRTLSNIDMEDLVIYGLAALGAVVLWIVGLLAAAKAASVDMLTLGGYVWSVVAWVTLAFAIIVTVILIVLAVHTFVVPSLTNYFIGRSSRRQLRNRIVNVESWDVSSHLHDR